MQVDRRPDDCRICWKPTASSVSEKKKRLTILGSSAEPLRHIIKTYLLESLQITDFSFEEPQFHTGDYICSSCITLLTNYDKAKKRFKELEQAVKTSLQAAIPSAVQASVERSPSVFSPIGRRRTRPPGGLTSTPKRLRLEPVAMGQPTVAPAPVKVYAIIVCMHVQHIVNHACVYNHAKAIRACSFIPFRVCSPSFTELIISYTCFNIKYTFLHSHTGTYQVYIQASVLHTSHVRSRHHQVSRPQALPCCSKAYIRPSPVAKVGHC